jgi:hypothetical protein
MRGQVSVSLPELPSKPLVRDRALVELARPEP